MNDRKDCKKLWIAGVVAFAALHAMEFVLHGILLKIVYARPHYLALWNPPDVMKGRMWAMTLGYAVCALLFTKIYVQGYEEAKPPIGQGVRYGLLAGGMLSAFHALVEYAVYPVSLKLALVWFASGIVQFVVLGALVAAIYRPRAA